ncbi:ISL3 family transposase [Paractinoplanes brasiliensis]|uniref:Transposase n=1 Tax=Paractinoplanes brasiliensis TaxID=52695 RepID=A0A4R6JZ96_9ACTN|nr:ISL3 family transposase [Actinoplanes brasiliensis]TDO41222.1 transposase [Actinoplanes brasiliensis]GID27494.1 ISL3 family transposase [Actinoplanes brasiliensis]
MVFPHLARLAIDRVQAQPTSVLLEAHIRTTDADCPACGKPSARIHSRYTRRVADAVVGARRMVLKLLVRRFFCLAPGCPTVTFVEQVPGLTSRYARRSQHASQALQDIGLALAGRAGARLADRLGLRAGRTTMLRVIRRIPDPASTPVTVLGIDDFALRRGHRYGTVLIDMATRRPIDLLPARDADTVGAWLQQHPGVEIVCRDRAGAYAEAARTHAPAAIQVADRWHLLHNLAGYVEKTVANHFRCLTTRHTDPTPTTEPTPEEPAATPPPAPTDGRLAARIRLRHQQVHDLHAAGKSIKAIVRELGLARETVRRYLRAAQVDDLLTQSSTGSRPSKIDPWVDHLRKRWNEGCTTITILHQEIRALGYTGGYSTLRDQLHSWRHHMPPPPDTPKPLKNRQVNSWILRHPDALTADEHAMFAQVRADCPHLDRLATHVTSFATMLIRRQGQNLDDWLAAVRADDLPHLHSFATGLQQDYDAVRNGLTLEHSSGAVEGNVNRIKMLKRQMYGRAGFALLRKRVLLSR